MYWKTTITPKTLLHESIYSGLRCCSRTSCLLRGRRMVPRGHRRQEIKLTHLHVAQPSGSVDHEKLLYEVSEETKEKSVTASQYSCTVSVGHNHSCLCSTVTMTNISSLKGDWRPVTGDRVRCVHLTNWSNWEHVSERPSSDCKSEHVI